MARGQRDDTDKGDFRGGRTPPRAAAPAQTVGQRQAAAVGQGMPYMQARGAQPIDNTGNARVAPPTQPGQAPLANVTSPQPPPTSGTMPAPGKTATPGNKPGQANFGQSGAVPPKSKGTAQPAIRPGAASPANRKKPPVILAPTPQQPAGGAQIRLPPAQPMPAQGGAQRPAGPQVGPGEVPQTQGQMQQPGGTPQPAGSKIPGGGSSHPDFANLTPEEIQHLQQHLQNFRQQNNVPPVAMPQQDFMPSPGQQPVDNQKQLPTVPSMAPQTGAPAPSPPGQSPADAYMQQPKPQLTPPQPTPVNQNGQFPTMGGQTPRGPQAGNGNVPQPPPTTPLGRAQAFNANMQTPGQMNPAPGGATPPTNPGSPIMKI